ncbi:MAG: DUF4249 family protein, partial [Prolixibacteraceae bacterium]|nr:DUF4249 family protein [Prolixibacteraceae bacterium]
MNKKYIIIALSIFFFISCEEDVVLDLGDIEKRLVVEASVSNVNNLAEVTLSYSQGFYEAPDLNKLKNAKVEISSADGKQSEVLSLNDNNVYVSNSLIPAYGMNYNLKIEVDDQLVEVSSKLPEKVEIE